MLSASSTWIRRCASGTRSGRAGERLWNSAGIGQVYIGEDGRPRAVLQVNADGSPAWLCCGTRGRISRLRRWVSQFSGDQGA
ncbi:hypothetical protein IGA85_28175 [Pseudomonas aeruginosa]|nr:hypothetical protein [Pseudomonas aeruginosa]